MLGKFIAQPSLKRKKEEVSNIAALRTLNKKYAFPVKLKKRTSIININNAS